MLCCLVDAITALERDFLAWGGGRVVQVRGGISARSSPTCVSPELPIHLAPWVWSCLAHLVVLSCSVFPAPPWSSEAHGRPLNVGGTLKGWTEQAVPLSLQVVYTESLSNPTLVVADIPALAEIAHSKVRRLLKSHC